MTAILTAFSPVDHPRELLQALRDDNHTVHFYCFDGDFSSSILLLAAISPLIQEIGRENYVSCDCCEEINLFLPDYSVIEIQQFMTFLTSYSGPGTNTERETFSQLLRFFGQQLRIEEIWKKEVEIEPTKEDLEISHVPEEPSNDSDSEVENDWNLDYQSCSDYEEAESAPIKKPSFKKTGKFSEEVLRSYDESRRLFVCRLCGTERKRSDRLALHLQWHEDHPGESYQTRNNCKICGRFNATYFMLKMHMTRMHTDMPKTFKCQHEGCGKFFRFKGELKIHGMTHSKERNFVCSECGERFRSKGQMELHATRRHNPDTRPRIPCEECGKLFRIQADLRNHLSRTHRARLERKHRCNDCDLTFRSEKSLLSHMTLHDPTRPLQCSRCSLRYKNKDALVAHEKTHDNAQYACEFCSIAFKRKDNLKRHIKSKHSTMSMIDKLMLNHSEQVNTDNHQLLIPHPTH